MKHLAIVKPDIIASIQSGAKTIESRLAVNRPAAWNCQIGDEILFKVSGGDVVLSATVKNIERYADLRPCDVESLAELYAIQVAASPQHPYWQAKRAARFAVFIEIENVESAFIHRAALPRSFGQAWYSNFEIPPQVKNQLQLL